MKKKILIIGALGQIGTELTLALRAKHGAEEVVAVDIRAPHALISDGPYEQIDVRDTDLLQKLIKRYNVGTLYHLAALLSASGEQNPMHTWQLNVDTVLNVLELAVALKLEQVFFPSSIAVFGPSAPKEQTPQQCYLDPTTIYGVTKVAAEQLCAYYRGKYKVDLRSLRYPGLISTKQSPSGGTTDYAGDMFKAALLQQSYACYLSADTRLPMMYMEDAILGTIQLMEADVGSISVRDSYNFAAFSCTPAELADAIRVQIPGFEVRYKPDFRQNIANSWPQCIDDQVAARDWNWKPAYTLEQMVNNMYQLSASVA